MKRKGLIAGSIFLATTGLAFANGGTFVPPHHVGHFYLGLGVSRDSPSYDVKQTTSVNYQYQNFRDTFSTEKNFVKVTKHDLGNDSWNGEIFGGYGIIFQNHYYLGAEVFGSLSDNSDASYRSNGVFKTSFEDTQIGRTVQLTIPFTESKKIDLEHSYGIALMPGVKISEHTLFYGRVGWIRSEFDLSASSVFNPSIAYDPDIAADFTLGVPLRKSVDETKNGLQLGLGLETRVYRHLGLRLEYDWDRYSDLNMTMQKSMHCTDKGGNEHNMVFRHTVNVDHPTVNQVKLAVSYHFV